jgi:hypothetical protein
MSESALHRSMVGHINEFVLEEYRDYCELVVSADVDSGPVDRPPPKIGSSRPDLFAECIDKDFLVIGEAKTEYDVENRHTDEQIVNYCKHLASNNGLLILCVLWHQVILMEEIVDFLKMEAGFERVDVKVLGVV